MMLQLSTITVASLPKYKYPVKTYLNVLRNWLIFCIILNAIFIPSHMQQCTSGGGACLPR